MVTSLRTRSLSHSTDVVETYTAIVQSLLQAQLDHIKLHPSLEPPSSFDDLSLFSGCLMKQACRNSQSKRCDVVTCTHSDGAICIMICLSISLSLSLSISPFLLRLFALHLGAYLLDLDPNDLPGVLLTHLASLHLVAVMASSLGEL